MNRALAREIVGGLRGSYAPAEELARLTGTDRHGWKHTLEWLDHSGLALLFWSRLKASGADRAIPIEIRDRLERNLLHHRLRVREMVTEFDSINRRLKGAGVNYAALKGFALIPEYCPDIFLRTTYDYDYLVAPESVSSAEHALSEAGYLRKEGTENHPIVYFHNAHHPRRPLSGDDLYSAKFPRVIELHYLFWDDATVRIPLTLPFDPLLRSKLRDLSLVANPSGLPAGRPVHFYALSEEDELIFQVLHVFRHILRNWCRLCSLFDIAYFLDRRAPDTVFWARFVERLNDDRPLSEIVAVVFLLAAGVFGATIPAPISVQIIRSLRRSLVLWVERYGWNSALNNFSDNKFSLFLHREFIRDQSVWREIRRARLFPIHRPNRAFHNTSPDVSSRLTASWKQGLYVAQRLRHHLVGAVQYGLESPRWYRTRSRAR